MKYAEGFVVFWRKMLPALSGLRSPWCIQQYSTREGAHYIDVMMSAMAPQITSVSIVCSSVCSGADQRKYQSSASLAFVRGIHWWPMNSPHKEPITRKMLPFDDAIMNLGYLSEAHRNLKSRDTLFVHNICVSCPIVLTNVVSRNLGLRCVSGGYLILHTTPRPVIPI